MKTIFDNFMLKKNNNDSGNRAPIYNLTTRWLFPIFLKMFANIIDIFNMELMCRSSINQVQLSYETIHSVTS